MNELATADAAAEDVSLSANLEAGKSYYLWIDNGGGGTISHITYEV
jgi:hypothetical protein